MEAPTIAAAMLAEWDHETANTRRMLERVPWDKRDWRPHPKSSTMGRLAIHLADLGGRPAMVLGTDSVDILARRAAAAPEPQSTAELLAVFDRGAAESRAALAAATPERLAETWTMRAGDRVIFSLPRAVAIRNIGMNHAVHHRAQLGVYLRLNDVPVPGMYGPSADEQ